MENKNRLTGGPLVRGVTCINIVFLTLLSVIVAALVYDRNKAELTARETELSRRAALNTAARLENSLDAARADALTLLELNGGRLPQYGTSGPRQPENAGFFVLHPMFAALLSSSGARLVNSAFFVEHKLNENAPERYLAAEPELMERAAVMEYTDSILLGNASPYFDAPVIALFFRDGRNSVFAAFFSADTFTPLLDGGPEKVYIVNDRDDIILHTDTGAVMSGQNYWQAPLVRLMRNSAAAGMDTVFDTGGETYLGAFQKLRTRGAEAAALCETPLNHIHGGLRRAARASLTLCGAALALVIAFGIALSFSARRYIRGAFLEQKKEIIESRRLENIFHALPGSRASDTDKLEKVALNGENRDVTIVFAGLKGRGAIKYLSPQRTLKLLDGALMLIQDSFAETGGAADKLDGDSLTGIWGAPFSDGGPQMDALNAVRGALILRAALVKRGSSGRRAGIADEADRRLTVSCGINSGVMLAGQIGPEGRSAYTLTGGAAKRARLLESLNRRFGTDILISESTMALAGKYFITEELPPVKLRGTSKPLRVFAVINVKVTKKGVEQPKPTNMAELCQMLKIARV